MSKIQNLRHGRAAFRISMNLFRLILIILAAFVAPLAVAQSDQANANSTKHARQPTKLNRLDHIIVVYQENWSFDSLYGFFPVANGLLNAARTAYPQVDAGGFLLTSVPQPLNNGVPDPRFNGVTLPVTPYNLARFVAPNETTGDIVHRYYHEIYQIDGGKNDKFVSGSDNGGLVMSYFDATNLPEGQLAQQFTLCDNFFHSAFGGSFLNHHFLIAAAPPVWPIPSTGPGPSVSDPNFPLTQDNQVTPDGFAVNTAFSINQPHPANITDPALLVPNQTNPTIGDRLSEKNISWKWYSGGWDDALAGRPDPLFQFHHQVFAFYANYADGTTAKAAHLQDEKNFFADLNNGHLPAVSFIKPLGPDNEHPGYANLLRGQQHVADIVHAVQNSSFWKNSVIIVTYDEHGGRWDHVHPPVSDRWGPGVRVPAIIISPFAKRGFVDHTQNETVSILKLIEERFDLAPLSSRDANANDLLEAFED